MFDFLKRKKMNNTKDLLTDFFVYNKMVELLAKYKSLQQLNRTDEANRLLTEAENIVTNHLKKYSNEPKAHLTMALFYQETGQLDRAAAILEQMLQSTEFRLTSDERLIISGAVQKNRREQPQKQRESGEPFTQIYCCQNCGRLINFASVPCQHCDWSPKSIEEAARSVMLSNLRFSVSALLTLSREMASGRTVDDCVPNLNKDAQTCLSNTSQRQGVEKIYSLIKENEQEHHRSLAQLLKCQNCGERIMFSITEECPHCGDVVNWPKMLRELACFDGLLWLFEQRIVLPKKKKAEFDDLVCLLVAMTNDLLQKQEGPSEKKRKYALELLSANAGFCDLNMGAVITLKDPKALEIYLIKDNMREDSEKYGILIYKEIESFISIMMHGVH